VAVNQLLSRKEAASLLRSAGVRPSSRLGQNFLVDRNVLDTIVAEVRRDAPIEVLEIGAGLGTVTRELAAVARQVTAVEIDRRLSAVLERTLKGLDNVQVLRQDILDLDISTRFTECPVLIVGNIPYRITAPILKHLVWHRTAISAVILLAQREVAEKIENSPGPAGTALGVLVRAYADFHMIKRVSRRSFYPIPAVDSILWRLSFLESPRFSAAPEVFFSMVRRLYGKRRKMLRSALGGILPPDRLKGAIRAAGIAPTSRGEDLSFAELDRLALAIGRIVQSDRFGKGTWAQ